MFLSRDFLVHEISFLLWGLLALVALIFLLGETYRHPERPPRPAYQMVEGGVLLFALIASLPHAPRALKTFRELLTPATRANLVLLTAERTEAGIDFHAGSTLGITPDGVLDYAELKTPHTIRGITFIGHVEFRMVSNPEGVWETRVLSGTLSAEQQMVDSEGIWCSPHTKLIFYGDLIRVWKCELARDYTREGVTFPAGSLLEYGYERTSCAITLPVTAAPVTISGLSIPGGSTIYVDFSPKLTLTNILTFGWVEIDGVRYTNFIRFTDDATWVRAELWQDATVKGVFHKKGESVDFTR